MSSAQQQDVIDREPEIKAAYLYNFGRYVEWPPSARSVGESGSPDFVIGVVGDSPVIAPLRTIAATKKVGGRAILIRQFKAATDFQACQVLFVPAGQDPELVAAILKKARETPTLVVGEVEGFALKQGQIGFYTDQNNMKFEINASCGGEGRTENQLETAEPGPDRRREAGELRNVHEATPRFFHSGQAQPAGDDDGRHRAHPGVRHVRDE